MSLLVSMGLAEALEAIVVGISRVRAEIVKSVRFSMGFLSTGDKAVKGSCVSQQ